MMAVEDPWVRLGPMLPGHGDALRRSEAAWAPGAAWRFNGRTPHPVEHASGLWRNVVGNVAVSARDGRFLGVVTAYDADHRSGTVWVSVMGVDPDERSGLLLLGLGHLITELFRNWSFHTVFAETTSLIQERFRSEGGRYLTEVGRLTEDLFVDGRYVDRIFLAARREEWMDSAGRQCLAFQARAAAAARRAALAPRTSFVRTGAHLEPDPV